jgi:hypothetical protein
VTGEYANVDIDESDVRADNCWIFVSSTFGISVPTPAAWPFASNLDGFRNDRWRLPHQWSIEITTLAPNIVLIHTEQCPLWVDTVDKVGAERREGLCWWPSAFILPLGRVCITCALTFDGTAAHLTLATCASGGGRQIWLASVLRFCAMAQRWNSSRAPERPRRRMRSKR